MAILWQGFRDSQGKLQEAERVLRETIAETLVKTFPAFEAEDLRNVFCCALDTLMSDGRLLDYEAREIHLVYHAGLFHEDMKRARVNRYVRAIADVLGRVRFPN